MSLSNHERKLTQYQPVICLDSDVPHVKVAITQFKVYHMTLPGHKLFSRILSVCLIVALTLLPIPSLTLADDPPSPGYFLRGDSNGDGRVDISDPIRTLNWLFSGAAVPPCLDAADANDSGKVDISDAIFTLNFLFNGSREPPPPGPRTPGGDPTPDNLSCARSLDNTAPTITDLTPAHGSLLNDPRPAISARYADSQSGIDIASIRLTLDAADVTAQSSVTTGSITFTPAVGLSNGAHMVILSVSDRAGNRARPQATFQILLNPAPVTPQSGFIHGQVFHAVTDQPLADATVTVRGVEGQALSRLDGRYQFPTPGTGTFLVTVEKEGFTIHQREIEVEGTRDVALPPAFLMPVDPQVTMIMPDKGGTATDSKGEVQIEFPPGAVNEPIEVRLTPLHEENTLPGPLPENIPPVFMAVDIKSNGVDFKRPVTVRFPNSLGLPPGIEIGFGFWRQDLYEWKQLSTGRVTEDGSSIEVLVSHFSTLLGSCAFIPPSEAEAPDLEDLAQATGLSWK